MTSQLHRYLLLESFAMQLDDAGSPDADAIRDLMDPIWYGLTNLEQDWLNDRGFLAGPPFNHRVDSVPSAAMSKVGVAGTSTSTQPGIARIDPPSLSKDDESFRSSDLFDVARDAFTVGQRPSTSAILTTNSSGRLKAVA